MQLLKTIRSKLNISELDRSNFNVNTCDSSYIEYWMRLLEAKCTTVKPSVLTGCLKLSHVSKFKRTVSNFRVLQSRFNSRSH